MVNEILKERINDRYSKYTEADSMGCANLAPFFDIQIGDVVLDLGCGSGNQALRLAEVVGANGFVYGLDISQAMIEKAQSKAAKENVKFTTGRIENLPYEDKSMNVVISNCVINHSTDKKAVFSEIFRVLKNGGHFLIGDVMAVERLPEKISNDPEKIAECWGGAIPKDEYLDVIKKLGFINLTELSGRKYYKNNFLLESVIIKGEKP